MSVNQSNQACKATISSELLNSQEFARTSCPEHEAGLLCVVQYPLGRVFVSTPNPFENITGGRVVKRTKNILKKSLPSLRGEEQ